MKIKIMRIVMFGLILFFYGCSNKVESYNIGIVGITPIITTREVGATENSQKNSGDSKNTTGDKKEFESNPNNLNNKSNTEERIEKLIPLIEKMIEKKEKEGLTPVSLIHVFIDIQRVPRKVTVISFDRKKQKLLYKLLIFIITLCLLEKKIRNIAKEIRITKSESIKVKIPTQKLLREKGINLQVNEKENKMLEYEVLDEFNLEKIRNLETDKKVCIGIKTLLVYATSILILYTILEALTLK